LARSGMAWQARLRVCPLRVRARDVGCTPFILRWPNAGPSTHPEVSYRSTNVKEDEARVGLPGPGRARRGRNGGARSGALRRGKVRLGRSG